MKEFSSSEDQKPKKWVPQSLNAFNSHSNLYGTPDDEIKQSPQPKVASIHVYRTKKSFGYTRKVKKSKERKAWVELSD